MLQWGRYGAHASWPQAVQWIAHSSLMRLYPGVNTVQRVASGPYRDDACDGIQEDVGAGDAAFDEALP